MATKNKIGRKKIAGAGNASVLSPKKKVESTLLAVPNGIEPLSICIGCAKDPSLKRFVRDHGAAGYGYGICHRSDLIATAPAKYDALCSLIRALVRFDYEEWTYNGHWGGTVEPSSMLSRENAIVEHASVSGFPRSAETSERFLVFRQQGYDGLRYSKLGRIRC